MEKQRADVALCLCGLCESRSKARALIKQRQALLDGVPIDKPSTLVPVDGGFSLSSDASLDVSRAGQKLRAAMEAFAIDPKGKVFADIGASTGGFTQCLLEYGAVKVYAVDVGKDQLHKSLREDSRVVNMEGTNARELTEKDFFDKIEGAVMDVSFISQTLIYPALARILPDGAPLVTLIKPQFEVGRENVGKNGIVKDKNGSLLQAVLLKLRLAAEDNGFQLVKTVTSPIKGSKGNTEYLGLFYKKSN
ncbi:MAG: TlyA family RNA methyltransferase [Clostridia bacterium]|nr:TlyA family RNA methyltransferase [Clostridia bacterium]